MKTLLHLYRQTPQNDFKESRPIFVEAMPTASELIETETGKADKKEAKILSRNDLNKAHEHIATTIDNLHLDDDKANESEAEKSLKTELNEHASKRIDGIITEYEGALEKLTSPKEANEQVVKSVQELIDQVKDRIAKAPKVTEEKAPEPEARAETPAEKPKVDQRKLLDAMQKRLGVNKLKKHEAFVKAVAKLDLSEEQVKAVNEGKDLALTDQQKDTFVTNLESELKGDKAELNEPAKELLKAVRNSLNTKEGEKSENALEKAFSAFQLLMVAKSAMESGDMQTIKDFLNDFEETKDITKVYENFQNANEYYQNTVKGIDDAHQLLAVANEVRGEEANQLFPDQEKYRGVVKGAATEHLAKTLGLSEAKISKVDGRNLIQGKKNGKTLNVWDMESGFQVDNATDSNHVVTLGSIEGTSLQALAANVNSTTIGTPAAETPSAETPKANAEEEKKEEKKAEEAKQS